MDSDPTIDRPGASQPDQTHGRSSEARDYDAGDYRDKIAMRAYELYLARGGVDGGDFDDWLAAEREVTTSNGKASRRDRGE